jgi:hypothetical protein
MPNPKDLRFSFDNIDVATRFIDAILKIPNMHGVTIHIDEDPQTTLSRNRKLSHEIMKDIKIIEDGIDSWDVEQCVVDAFTRLKKHLDSISVK